MEEKQDAQGVGGEDFRCFMGFRDEFKYAVVASVAFDGVKLMDAIEVRWDEIVEPRIKELTKRVLEAEGWGKDATTEIRAQSLYERFWVKEEK